MSLIQKDAPNFTATALIDGQFKQVSLSDYAGKYVVLFFYPKDFTFVCPTEIVAFSEAASKFEALNTVVLGVSTDNEFCHLAWTEKPRNQGGLGKVNIPLIADTNHKISRAYNVLIEEEGIALRGLFIIDTKQKVRILQVNDLPVGRSVEETLRLLEALQFTEEHGEVCPANWAKGKDTIVPDVQGSKEFFSKQ
ncbi:peroxiredoxin [Neoconidiobolus thromboides FSU 785]|nr:peroxiredoxin [Neoconidiobolus thromboides FSU 785]